MAVDKLVDSTQLDTDLTAVANAIRTKSGTSAQLVFPSGFVSAVEAIETGGGGLSLEDALNKQLTGDIVLTVNPARTEAAASILAGLFFGNRITSLRCTGLVTCPEQFVAQVLNKTDLLTVEMDSTSIGNSVCQYANKLTSVRFPNANREKVNYGWQGANAFLNCSRLTDVYIPLCPTIQENMFKACTSLSFLDLPSVTRIRANAFHSCSALKTIVLRSSTVVTLENVNAFTTSTPFASGGSGGTIYVPSSLISSYQTATNWSTLYGYGATTFAAIEGSEYDT